MVCRLLYWRVPGEMVPIECNLPTFTKVVDLDSSLRVLPPLAAYVSILTDLAQLGVAGPVVGYQIGAVRSL